MSRLKKAGECIYELPRQGAMRVSGYLFASPALLEEMDEKVLRQLENVACLPGIVGGAMAMPDAHWGYGFPIGGVAAFDPLAGGIISVGGVGYDISCGVRSIRTGLSRQEVEADLERLVSRLFQVIPAGVGSKGAISLDAGKLDEVLARGAVWAVDRGYGSRDDLRFIEDGGCLSGADPSKVSPLAKERQRRQVGTLGSGNHYLEIQYVEQVFDSEAAKAFGLAKGEVVVSIHCGSRALGHQIGTDYIQLLGRAAKKYGIPIRERELVCAPIDSPEGRDYFAAMACGVNCALANRQVIGSMVAEILLEVFPRCEPSLIYDVSHNTCKPEEHLVDEKPRLLYVHRKGATRAFGPGRLELPVEYREVGQPLFIGGTMGTASYVLAGTESGEELAWASACHGAGRAMSRRAALKRWKGKKVISDLAGKGILVRAASMRGAAEEAPQAYKDIHEVVEATHRAGLARKVAVVRPMAVIKG